MSDPKPVWRYETPEEFARWLYQNAIVKITHHRAMTGADTSEEWMMLHPNTGPARRAPKMDDWSDVQFRLDHRGLVSLRAEAGSTMFKILTWEEAHAGKLAEYHKLKGELGL